MINSKISKQNVEKVRQKTYKIKLWVGSYHHVKKLFEIFSLKVIDLNRDEYAGIDVKDLKLGDYREMTYKEIVAIKNLTNHSK